MIRSIMATELRWDFDRIGKTSWPDASNLLNYWHKTPPVGQILNLYFKARGLVLKPASEPSSFEKLMQDKSRKLDTSHIPPHLKALLDEVAEGKHARRVR